MEKEQTSLKGKFRIAVLRDNQEVDYREIDNTIMNAGKALVSGLMLTDIGGTAFDYVSVGTGTSAPNETQTSLIGEKYRSACTGSQVTTTVTNDTARLTASIAMTATAALAEAGVFNSSSAGTMLARTTFSTVNVNSGDTLNVGYDVAVS